jgi:hypothetical protein
LTNSKCESPVCRYSILKQRLARQLKSENCDVKKLDLVSITKAAERTITNVGRVLFLYLHTPTLPELELAA